VVAPIVPLTDELQVWELRACWPSSVEHRASSGWSFVTLRDVGTTQAELYEMWRDILEGPYTTLRPAGFRLDRVVIVDTWPGLVADFVVDYPWPGPPFEGEGEPTHQAVSPIISWRSGNEGRSYRGRTFWGPIRQEFVGEGNRIIPPASGAIEWFATQMIRQFGPLQPVFVPGFAIISRRHNGSPNVPWTFVRPEYALVDLNIRTIRRRLKEPTEYSVPLD
jgi:hypothetical protein